MSIGVNVICMVKNISEGSMQKGGKRIEAVCQIGDGRSPRLKEGPD